jgi:5-methylcytosine-specific restriction protein A
MPWKKTPADRQRDAQVYGSPEYKRNRAAALRRADRRCEECGRRDRSLQTDHIIPVTQGGTHDLANLKVLCSGPGSCHAKKTATEGGGYRKRSTPVDPPFSPRTQW